MRGGIDDLPQAMLGDVNLFLHDDEDGNAPGRPLVGEINIMVAAPRARRRGRGRCVLSSFVWYVLLHREGIVRDYEERNFTVLQDSDDEIESSRCILVALVAKIDKENVASIGLFESMGFKKARPEPNYFGEVELRLDLDGMKQVGENFVELRVTPELLRYGAPES